ncbi:MAG: EAL domain-containing protein, partial [Deltaproteobacteria bacterium]|nr:EAL domain-containing protein [Deltaproteobacteria bacterium]
LLSIVGLAKDITTRKLAEEKAALMSRLYEALSATNKAVLHSASSGDLFQRVCDAAVLGGDFPIAWIAEVERPGDRICYAAVAGRGRELIGEAPLTLAPADLRSKGPTEGALLTGETVVENDLVRGFESRSGSSGPSDSPESWDVASVAAVPLMRGGRVVACLTVFSAEKGTFDSQLVALLEEMGRDVSFALDNFDREERRRAAEVALRASEARWRTIVQNEPECVKVLDREGRLLEMNPAGLSMIQATLDQVVGKRAAGLVAEEDQPAFDEMVAAVFRGETRHLVFDMIGLEGRRLTLETTSGPLWDTTAEPTVVGAVLGVTRDVTERKLDEERLRRAATVFSSSREGFVVTNDKGDIEEINDAFTAITGYSRAEAMGRNMRILHSGRQDPSFYQAMWTELHRCGQWQGEIWNRRKDDTVFPAWLSISVVRGEQSRVAGYVGVFSDISTLTTTKERLERLARYDPLTDLPNRLLLESYLGLAVSRSLRSGRVGAVLFLDLDRFKNVNDSLGHTAGDEVLRATARRLQDRLREGDLIARLGGDEFVILLEDVGGPRVAATVASDLIDRFRQPFVLGGGREVYVGLSIGISMFPADGDRVEVLIQNADAALYSAKEQGRNTFRFYSEALTIAANERLALEADLRRGLANDQFFVQFQPIVRLADGRIEGVEALLRWQSPERGLVMPATFIGVTEDTGLIVPLGDRVLQWSCRQMKSWRDAGLSLERVAVNVSPRQLVQRDFELRVAAILAETGLDARYLELEITESAIMEQGADAEVRLAALKRLGLRLSIDDFGTGYSSLSHLQRFPIDTFKIDRSFIASVPEDRTQREIVLTILSLGRQLGLHVIAEGVETQQQVDFLRENGCDSAQGFFFSASVSADRIDEIVLCG